jgi:PKD repeat protein
MRAGSRAVFVAAIVAVALALHAGEECPAPAQPEVHWIGLSSGCTEANALPCAAGETIVFSVTPLGGGAYPACTTYEWNFGGGLEPSTQASPSRVFPAEGAFFVNVRVSGGGSDGFDGREITVTTVVPVVESFVATPVSIRRGQTVVLSWSTKYAASVRIDPIGVTLDATVTSYSFAPAVTRTYTLTAFGAAAFRISKPVTVYVSAKRRAVRR